MKKIALVICLLLGGCGILSLGVTNSPSPPGCGGRPNIPGCPS